MKIRNTHKKFKEAKKVEKAIHAQELLKDEATSPQLDANEKKETPLTSDMDFKKSREKATESFIKNTSKEEKLKKIDKKLEKIEKKTDALIKKHSAPKKTSSKPSAKPRQSQALHKTSRDVSFLSFRMMPPSKSPKKILTHLIERAEKEGGDWIAIIWSDELKDLTGKSAHQNSNTIQRLSKEGWFEVLDFNSNGSRVLKLNAEALNLNIIQ